MNIMNMVSKYVTTPLVVGSLVFGVASCDVSKKSDSTSAYQIERADIESRAAEKRPFAHSNPKKNINYDFLLVDTLPGDSTIDYYISNKDTVIYTAKEFQDIDPNTAARIQQLFKAYYNTNQN